MPICVNSPDGGATLVGSLVAVCNGRLRFGPDLEQNLARGDETFGQFTRSVDEYILRHRLAAPEGRGVTATPGLYFLGLSHLHKVKSAFLWGVGEDAAYLAEHIGNRK